MEPVYTIIILLVFTKSAIITSHTYNLFEKRFGAGTLHRKKKSSRPCPIFSSVNSVPVFAAVNLSGVVRHSVTTTTKKHPSKMI